MGMFTRTAGSRTWPDGQSTAPSGGASYGDRPSEQARAARRRARTRGRGAVAVGTLAAGVVTLARLVMLVAALIALLIGLAILLRDVDANPHNTIVKGVHAAANLFAGAFTGLATFDGHPKRAITVDWGIALVTYVAAGMLLATVVRRLGRSGLAWGRGRGAGAVT
jgi:hypothetical protein